MGAGVAAIAATASMPKAWANAPVEYQLRAEPASAPLIGSDTHWTNVLAYNGAVPGPVLRIKQGEPARMIVYNGLDRDTTVHWHGIRLPNAMDGVPGLTQPPIQAGESFTYNFIPPDAGTFWYHPHANSLEQIGRGLAGLLIVEESEPVAVDRDVAWLLQDFRLDRSGQIAGGFGSMMDASMSGRVGNTVKINGRSPGDFKVRTNERIRLRLANAALARIFALRFTGHSPSIIAIDGQPCEPHSPADGRIVLGPAMRVDILLDAVGSPRERFAVIDDFYDDLSYTLATIAYGPEPFRSEPHGTEVVLPPNPLPEPKLAGARTQELLLQGGMMGGGKLRGVGGMKGMSMPGMDGGPIWAINGMSMVGDGKMDMPSVFTLQRGESCRLLFRNQTAWHHTMHIHGFAMQVLTRNSITVPFRQWQDSVLLAPRDVVECAFVADNPGNWMLHCHITDHQMTGLMTVFHVN